MHLNDIAAMPASVRQTDTRHAKHASGNERGFGDLVEGEVSGGRHIGTDEESEVVEVLDRSSDIIHLDMPKVERVGQNDFDGEHRRVDLDTPRPAKALRMADRLSIDWLSLRMPGRDDAANAEKIDAAEQVASVDGAHAMPSPVASNATEEVDGDGMSADRQAAAMQTKGGERTNDEKQQRTVTGTEARSIDGARTPTTRDPAQNSATVQTIEPQAASAEPADDRRATTRMQAALERLDERVDTGAPRLQIGSASVQTIPAPSVELQTPARTVLAALSEHAPEMARPVAAATMQQQTTEPMRILRIQLHPLELGVVTAKLSSQGGTMAVELQTETRDAAARLAADSNDIVKSLRGLGIEVDRVTVTQSSSSTTPQTDQQAGNSDRGERFADEAAGRESAREHGKGSAGGGSGLNGENDVQPVPNQRGVFI